MLKKNSMGDCIEYLTSYKGKYIIKNRLNLRKHVRSECFVFYNMVNFYFLVNLFAGAVFFIVRSCNIESLTLYFSKRVI